MMGRGFYAMMNAARLAEADKAAHDRQNYARAMGRDPGRDVSPEQLLAENILGTRCERAAAIFFPTLPWHAFKEGPVDDTPDLGDFIDVKGVRLDWHELLVPKLKIKPAWAYLLVSAESHPYYWIAGWEWGDELIAIASLKHARPAYARAACELQSVVNLQQIVEHTTRREAA